MNTLAMTLNALGRPVPDSVNGRPISPYSTPDGKPPTGRRHGPPTPTCASYPANGDKRTPTLREALAIAGLRDGMVISTHHHLRNGDLIAAQVFAAAAEHGVRDLIWFPSAAFPCHEPLVDAMESGLIHHIEGSLNGNLGRYASSGRMRGTAVLRSHGNRYRTIQDGEIEVDIAVLACPSADQFGNANGLYGPSACGSLGFAMADASYANHVIAVTDNLVKFPCLPIQIAGNLVDQVVVVDQIGDSSQIVSGTTRITRSPDQLLIAESAAQFCNAAGLLRDGFSFQAGAGGISLAVTIFLRDLMRESRIRASFVRGGSTRYLVEMLEEGLTGAILDGQTFDLDGVRSLRDNPRHVPTSPFNSYCRHVKGNIASILDIAVLGATEIDLDFNANVVTHSDGLLLHGIGGWQDALFASCTILTVPTFRNRLPVIRENLTTICGPSELIDVVVTERGIAINPRRSDLLEAVAGKGLPIRTLEELKAGAEKLCGGTPEKPRLTEQPIGVVTWVDGSAMDTIFAVEDEVWRP